MNETGDLGAIKQMWLNEGGVATVVPLKVLEKGDIIVKNNDKGMPYLDLRELEAEVALSFIQTVCVCVSSPPVFKLGAVRLEIPISSAQLMTSPPYPRTR